MSAAPVYALPVADRWLVYAPLHDVVALANGAALRAWQAGELSRDEPLARALSAPAWAAPGPPAGEPCPAFLGLLPTRACNLACAYCDFGAPGASTARMPLAVATAAVDWIAARAEAAGRPEFHVLFFGGEPFEAPEVVEVAVHRARSEAARRGLVPWIGASTNGCFDAPMARFVGDHFDAIALSLDGPPDVHDRHRPAVGGGPSFAVVAETARRLADSTVELCLRACVTADSVARLPEIAAWMIDEFRPAAISFESLSPGRRAARAGLRVPDPYTFAVRALEAQQRAEERGVRLVYAAASGLSPRYSFCPVGTDAVIVSPDGRASACYLPAGAWRRRGLDLDFGRVEAGGGVRLDTAAVERARALPAANPGCAGCFCRFTCAGGCHVRPGRPGAGDAYGPFCVQTRLVTAGLLLRDLGAGELLAQWLADAAALRRLALQGCDALPVMDHAPPARDRPSPPVPARFVEGCA